MALWVGWAFAQGLTHRVSRDPLPAREVERPLVLPKGWSEVVASIGRTRWSDIDYRPFPGEVTRREASLSARVSMGPTVELRARLPYADVHTGTVLGGGVGSATVGVAWLLARSEAPARSLGVHMGWTTPSAHTRLPLGSATHQLQGWLTARQQLGGLRLTAGLGGRAAPPRETPWLRDAHEQAQQVDLGEAALGRVQGLLQAGPLWGSLDLGAGFVGPDRIDGVVVAPAGWSVQLRPRGAVQWSRGLTTGIEGWHPLVERAALLAPAVDPLVAGRGLGLFVAASL